MLDHIRKQDYTVFIFLFPLAHSFLSVFMLLQMGRLLFFFIAE